MATSPGARTRSLPTRARSSIAYAACCRRRGRRRSGLLHRQIVGVERKAGHAADDERRPELTLLRKSARAAFLTRLGAPGALDVGGAEAEVQAGSVAVCA